MCEVGDLTFFADNAGYHINGEFPSTGKDPYPLMQFTGLGSNGQEWYDGDILENDGDWYEIAWDKDEARWEAIGIRSTGEILALHELVSSETWVQGNVYQNPELTKPVE